MHTSTILFLSRKKTKKIKRSRTNVKTQRKNIQLRSEDAMIVQIHRQQQSSNSVLDLYF